jgi:hypothetical protein
MRVMVTVLVAVLFLPHGGSAEPEIGTICVAARADDPFRGQVIPPTGEVSSNGLQVKVDKRPAIPWPQRESLKIEGLDLKERHLLAVVDAHGKAIESLNLCGFASQLTTVNTCVCPTTATKESD